MKTITEQQYNSLSTLIYSSLISNSDFGLGEMGECKDEAERIIDEWMAAEKIIFEQAADKKNVCMKQKNDADGTVWYGIYVNNFCEKAFLCNQFNEADIYFNKVVENLQNNIHNGYKILKEIII